MKLSTMFAALALFAAAGVGASEARADGCYICGSGSSNACADYCRYGDDDTQEARARCRRMGCRIGGTASCPSAANVTICRAPARAAPALACVAVSECFAGDVATAHRRGASRGGRCAASR